MLQEELPTILSSNKRSFWVRQWILRRNQLGASETLIRELALENNKGYKKNVKNCYRKFRAT